MTGKPRQKAVRAGRELQRVLTEVAEVARHLWERGWAEKNAGNISVDVTEYYNDVSQVSTRCPFIALPPALTEGLEGRHFLVTLSGSRMRDIETSIGEMTCVIRISEKANGYHIIWGNERLSPGIPTSELPSHLAIHQRFLQNGTNRKAIVHTHPTELIALTQSAQYNDARKLSQLLCAMHPEVILAIPEGVGFVPYSLPGTEEVVRATADALDGHSIVLWGKHGCIATGIDVFDAFDTIDVVAKAARIFFLCQGAGFAPQGLTDSQLQELRQKFIPEE